MTLANTTPANTNETVCVDCEDAILEGYSGCGECEAPDEAWEYTTPADVWEE